MNTGIMINENISIGIELGSTRIKTVLIDKSGTILATGGFDWENQLIDNIWTYSQQDIWFGVQEAYRNLAKSVQQKYHTSITKVSAIGISAMMHGYMPFDCDKKLLVPFRTWRNNITANSAKKLTALFQHNIPQRWSIAHLYQAILNEEEHLPQINYLTTLSGYIHWCLTDQKVLGIGDASGMFPINSQSCDYDQAMLQKFDQLIAEKQYSWKIANILPKVLRAGENAGYLTEKGAGLIDPSGNLQAGCPLCPPEGDAGTGMIATNSIKARTGNISAGTSAFAMIVLEKKLSQVYENLDMVTTPAGKTVAMAHANNCTTDINAWMKIFSECLTAFGMHHTSTRLYETLFTQALAGDEDCGQVLSYGFYSGEHGLGLASGCPLLIHPTQSAFNLANLIRSLLYSAFGAMKLGMDILTQQEKVEISQILAHGGIFKTQNVASKILASALNIPITTMETATEGGAWGIALLASYLHKANDLSLEQYLDRHIFQNAEVITVYPVQEMVKGYEKFIQHYQKGLHVAKAAAKVR
ncbi:carbohydrate kinase FGGY [Actinobacillus seminis]|uniref:Carbohydrate kinase FGGY n=1 Tax=Actinobacillus seminis TaxID=722 RepID=A0A380VH68_9PAST|nr:FGGY-family carbohydrate kinase [Actinobacillus seminis]SUU38844.1 carbohydrate kinase FGGY [Actinobacillus seminis]